jgi:hypothetical protein
MRRHLKPRTDPGPYSTFADYSGNVDLKPGRVYKGLLDILQNNKSAWALNGALYELDCAHFFSVIETSGYKVLHIGRKFAVGEGRSRRLSDIDLVVKLPSGECVLIQAKSTMESLRKDPEAFGRNFLKQLAQLPTSGQNALGNIPIGEQFAKHVRITMPQGQYNPAHFTAAVEKMVEGIAARGGDDLDVEKIRKQMRKQWGLDAEDGRAFEDHEAVKLFLPAN